MAWNHWVLEGYIWWRSLCKVTEKERKGLEIQKCARPVIKRSESDQEGERGRK